MNPHDDPRFRMSAPPAGSTQQQSLGDKPANAPADYHPPDVVQVCCVLTGDWPGSSAKVRERCPDLGAHYVECLYAMVSRFAPPNIKWSFTCFTDRPTIPGIHCRPIHPRMWSYFAKLYLFSPECFPLNSRVLFFDLDTCLVRSWLPLAEVPLEKIVMLRDIWAQAMPASGVMSWRVTSDTQRIWKDFEPSAQTRPPYTHPHPKRFPPNVPTPIHVGIRTDEQWLHHYTVHNQWTAWQDLCPGEFLSYKYNIQRSMNVSGRPGAPPLTEEDARKARVIYFHGHPRPHQVVHKWNPFWRGIIDPPPPKITAGGILHD